MTKVAQETGPGPADLAPARARPSWSDRLTDRIDGLPGPAWLPYAVVFVAVIVAANGAAWLEGIQPAGAIDPYRSTFAVYAIVGVASIHYLDRLAREALGRFRPALAVGDDEFRWLEHELTTLPARNANAWTLGGFFLASQYLVTSLDVALQLQRAPLTFLVEAAVSLVSFSAAGVLVYHTLRQLRIISRIHARAGRIDAFRLAPVYAFSAVTARTGTIFLLLTYLSVATDPATFLNPTLALFTGLTILVGLACFVLPLVGMHRRIASEKEALADEASGNLELALARLNRSVAEDDLREADALNKQISSLVIQRDVIERIPTWPWRANTVRGFVTAVVLPILLWVLFRVLDRTLG